MRTIWTVISGLAIINLLALTIFVGWLWQSGRLNGQRLQEVRSIIAPTIAEAEALAAEEAANEQAAEQAALEQHYRENPPRSSTQQVALHEQQGRSQSLMIQRLQAERDLLTRQLNEAMERIEGQEARMQQQRQAILDELEQRQQRKNDAQFQQAVSLYQSVQPKQAKQMLINLIDAGEMDQAVAYLDAMQSRAASNILKQFKSEQELQLATDLLERLRALEDLNAQAANDNINAAHEPGDAPAFNPVDNQGGEPAP